MLHVPLQACILSEEKQKFKYPDYRKILMFVFKSKSDIKLFLAVKKQVLTFRNPSICCCCCCFFNNITCGEIL